MITNQNKPKSDLIDKKHILVGKTVLTQPPAQSFGDFPSFKQNGSYFFG
jgi:hypothetical protein